MHKWIKYKPVNYNSVNYKCFITSSIQRKMIIEAIMIIFSRHWNNSYCELQKLILQNTAVFFLDCMMLIVWRNSRAPLPMGINPLMYVFIIPESQLSNPSMFAANLLVRETLYLSKDAPEINTPLLWRVLRQSR